MTLPTGGTMSFGDILNELRIANPGRGLPISLNDSDVRALAGKPSGTVSFSDFYGKSAQPPTQPIPTLTASAFGDDTYQNNTDTAGSIGATSVTSVQGGQPPYSYSWTITARGGGITFGPLNQPSLTGSYSYQRLSSGTTSFTAYCTIADSAGNSVVTNTVTSSMTWGAA